MLKCGLCLVRWPPLLGACQQLTWQRLPWPSRFRPQTHPMPRRLQPKGPPLVPTLCSILGPRLQPAHQRRFQLIHRRKMLSSRLARNGACCALASIYCWALWLPDLRWADGFVVGELPLGRPAPKPKAKATGGGSSGGSRRRTVERYSPAYHNISYLSEPRFARSKCAPSTNVVFVQSIEDSHLIEWLHHCDCENLTMVMLQQCSREELFCLVFLATGLSPTSRIPAFLG